MSVEIFCCYARKDQQLLDELKTHLKPLQRQGLIRIWNDTDISPGANWEVEIHKYLDAAQVILLLMSPDFINSEYCYSIEMDRAMKLYEQGKAYVIPVILRPTDWEYTPFSKLQVLPKEGKPLTTWNNRDEAFLNVAKGIRKVIEEFTPPLPTNEQLFKPAEESEISSTTSEASSTSLVTTATEEAEKSIVHLNYICLLLIKIQKRLNQPETFKTEGNLEGILIDWKNVNIVQVIEVILYEMKRTREYIKDSQETSILTKKTTLLLKIDASIKEVNNARPVSYINKRFFSMFLSVTPTIIESSAALFTLRIYYNNHLKKCKAYLLDMLVEIS